MRAPEGRRAPLWTPVPGTVTGAKHEALVCCEETAGASGAVATPAVATRATAVAAMVRMGVMSCSWGLGSAPSTDEGARPNGRSRTWRVGTHNGVVGPKSLVAGS